MHSLERARGDKASGQREAADELLDLGAATLGEAGADPMAPRIRPAWPGAAVAGPAYPVRCTPGDNLAVHVAVTRAPAGGVLVVDVGGTPGRGYWGEVLMTAALARSIAGLVIDGGVRDTAALECARFSVFATMVALPGASKRAAGTVGQPVSVGGVRVAPGDWIVGDRDGVVVVRADRLAAVLAAGRTRAAKEQEFLASLRQGATTIDLLGLDPAPIQGDPSSQP